MAWTEKELERYRKLNDGRDPISYKPDKPKQYKPDKPHIPSDKARGLAALKAMGKITEEQEAQGLAGMGNLTDAERVRMFLSIQQAKDKQASEQGDPLAAYQASAAADSLARITGLPRELPPEKPDTTTTKPPLGQRISESFIKNFRPAVETQVPIMSAIKGGKTIYDFAKSKVNVNRMGNVWEMKTDADWDSIPSGKNILVHTTDGRYVRKP